MENEPSVSKATVEYYDPSGVFPIASRQLQSHFPLRDLHWKSPSRPLRSIDTLEVELVPARDSDQPISRHGTPALDYGSPARVPGEIRHQIPGLRRTPYLKVYLLRCDDNEAYKSTARKNIREWLKTHTPASQSSSTRSSQENHEAFEWLILHVVLPNTGAASQSSSSSSSAKSENVPTEKSGGSSKLLGRISSTILEKIKADFNVTSKSAPDRVAQLRLTPDDLVSDSTRPSSPASSHDYQETPQERAAAKQDIVNKFKTLILSPFSLRVSQYEDDLRERDAQRSLPGWNFCMFFMLKEGLTRGFESIGLVDDALIGYDELSLGLENAINEGGDDDMTTRSDSFLKYTKEMKDILLQCLTSDSTPEAFWKGDTNIVSTSRKDYRNLIMNSNVSLFDFQCYIFARQMAILQRMGAHHEPRRGSTANLPNQANMAPTDHVAPLSELCQRAGSFISMASRTLRAELSQAAASQGVEVPPSLIDNMTASFAFAVAEQVLTATDIPALTRLQPSSSSPDLHRGMDRLQHPARRSSLQPRSSSQQPGPDNPIAMLKRLEESLAPQPGEDMLRAVPVTELGTLAGHRADLLLLQRQIVERLGDKKDWAVGLPRLKAEIHAKDASYNDVDLNDEKEETVNDAKPTNSLSSDFTKHDSRGVLYSILLDALATPEDFHEYYEKLTNLALTQCALALRLKSVERLIADLAILRFDKGDPVTAASYLSRVIPSFADRNWSLIETELVKVHASCLRKLNRKDDYVRMALSILAKAAARQKASLEVRVDNRLRLSKIWLDDASPESQGILGDLLSVSEELPCDVIVPMSDFFVDITVKPYIRHFEDKDGFSLDLKLRYLLLKSLPVSSIKMKLKSIDPPFREFWLENPEAITLTAGLNKIRLEAQITAFGSFAIEKLVIKSHRISFETEMRRSPALTTASQPTQLGFDEGSVLGRLPHVFCYASNDALAIKMMVSKEIYIDKTRVMEIELQTGRNEVLKGQLSLKAASAGLRLMTAEASVTDDKITLTKGKAPGLFEMADLPARSSIMVLVPYALDSNLPQITVGLGYTYTTPEGTFQYMSDPTIVTDLALDVSVHDLFRAGLLYSRFQIRASRGIPLIVHSVNLEQTDRYAVQGPPCKLTPMLVLPKQDGTVLYKIRPKDDKADRQSIKEEKPLLLDVTYMSMNEVVILSTEEVLLKALNEAGFGRFHEAIRHALVQPFQYLSHEKLEEVALLNEFHLPSYESMGWHELLDGLDPATRQELGSWLQKWHAENTVISVASLTAANNDDAALNDHLHSIKISVPLPRLHILHTAQLSLSNAAPFVAAGSVVPATISIVHTRRWDSPSALTSATSGAIPNAPIDFFVEVDAPADTWLIGGQRRTRFSAAEAETKTFELMLVPLRTGHLLLPEVVVRLTAKAAEELTCETDYRGLGVSVVVVGDVKSATIGVNEGSGGQEVVLLRNERRG